MTAVARLWPRPKAEKLLKTPTANLASNGAPQHPDKRKMGGHGPTLEDELAFLLNVDPDQPDPNTRTSPADWWNEFGPAVRRWELLLRRPAPVPIEFGPRGGLKLRARFGEWMMGLPEGWVTNVSDLTRAEQIARIGNGACPQQAFTAYRWLKCANE